MTSDLIHKVLKEYETRKKELGKNNNPMHAQKDVFASSKLDRVVTLLTTEMSPGRSFITFLGSHEYGDSGKFYQGKSLYDVMSSVTADNKERLVEMAHYGKWLMEHGKSNDGNKEAGKLIYRMAVAKAFELGVYDELVKSSNNIIEAHSRETWKANFSSEKTKDYALPSFAADLKKGKDSIGKQSYSYRVHLRMEKI